MYLHIFLEVSFRFDDYVWAEIQASSIRECFVSDGGGVIRHDLHHRNVANHGLQLLLNRQKRLLASFHNLPTSPFAGVSFETNFLSFTVLLMRAPLKPAGFDYLFRWYRWRPLHHQKNGGLSIGDSKTYLSFTIWCSDPTNVQKKRSPHTRFENERPSCFLIAWPTGFSQ